VLINVVGNIVCGMLLPRILPGTPPGMVPEDSSASSGSGGGTSPQLIVPYTLDTNDMRFATPQGFNTGDHFFDYLRDAFDVLYAEGDEAPKMLSIGMHCRLLGRPGRFRGLQRFLDHIEKHDRVWVTRRVDIARHWREHHPYQPNHQNEGKA
jgi:peptidoglycan/xylan/chitin deacetylase (PgdA/CDA1 family)